MSQKSAREMLGEGLREMGVLLVSFYGVSALIKVGGLGWPEVLQRDCRHAGRLRSVVAGHEHRIEGVSMDRILIALIAPVGFAILAMVLTPILFKKHWNRRDGERNTNTH